MMGASSKMVSIKCIFVDKSNNVFDFKKSQPLIVFAGVIRLRRTPNLAWERESSY